MSAPRSQFPSESERERAVPRDSSPAHLQSDPPSVSPTATPRRPSKSPEARSQPGIHRASSPKAASTAATATVGECAERRWKTSRNDRGESRRSSSAKTRVPRTTPEETASSTHEAEPENESSPPTPPAAPESAKAERWRRARPATE